MNNSDKMKEEYENTISELISQQKENWKIYKSIISKLKDDFVERDEVIDTIASAFISKTNTLLIGSPGTAKSLIIKRFAQELGIGGDDFFEYLLTKYSEPTEIFGPPDLNELKKGVYEFNSKKGKLQHAKIAFIDEVFNANSAILNALLMIINEKRFILGDTRKDNLDLLAVFGASNQTPDDPELMAFFDRFPVRVLVENINANGNKEGTINNYADLIFKSLIFEEEGSSTLSDKKIIEISDFVESMNKIIITKLKLLIQFDEQKNVMKYITDYLKWNKNVAMESALLISDRSLKSIAKMIVAYSLIASGKLEIEPSLNFKDYCHFILEKTWNKEEERDEIRQIIGRIN